MFDQQDLNSLFRYCHALCDARQDACDLLQSGVERCLRAPPEDPERRLPYARRVIRNLRYDELRRQRLVAFEPLDDESFITELSFNSLESIIIDQDELEHAWRSMTVVEREILYLWAVEGFTAEEVAAQLERPKGSILSIIHRMRKRLQRPPSINKGASRS